MEGDDPRPALPLDPGYELCFECEGSGICPWCKGTGWMDDVPTDRCFMCGGSMKCAMCAGSGQLRIGSGEAGRAL